MSEIIEDYGASPPFTAGEDMNSKIEDLLKLGFDAANRYSRGEGSFKLADLKGIEVCTKK